jgi:hypothetical protein
MNPVDGVSSVVNVFLNAHLSMNESPASVKPRLYEKSPSTVTSLELQRFFSARAQVGAEIRASFRGVLAKEKVTKTSPINRRSRNRIRKIQCHRLPRASQSWSENGYTVQ